HTLSLHDALPISDLGAAVQARVELRRGAGLHLRAERQAVRSPMRRRPAARPRAAAGDLRAFRFGRRPGGPAVGAAPMTALLRTLKSRFGNRPDSEHGQALTRVAMLVVVLAYLELVVRGHPGVERGLALSLNFLALEFVVAIGILAWIAARPGVSYPRRVVGMLADYSL